MNLDELQMKAELASVLPWEKSAAETPYAHKSQFLNAITPEVVLKLLKVARAADDYCTAFNAALDLSESLDGEAFYSANDKANLTYRALRTALEELK